ncbi:VWA domain-containing protein [Thioalkalivibrio sp.]|uniref:VWA domain-containing protein n=1 Tax=Thioalkalivibrio sp. TaxID=2093813 RepID=UPI0012D5469F|nr:VWA domain-containing protein [Thioalkalivibrio sp.]TVP81693.1 MAG: VWA domain-containing protein [Thioalkalivibrio sp.]
MAEADDLVAIEEVLQQLERVSFVAHRDTRTALPAIREFGAAQARFWIETARDLFLHDREAGKSFLRHSARLAENSGVVEPWTGQAREFLQWVNSHYALEGFLAQVDRVWRAWGEAGEREWFAIGLRWCGRSLADARAYFETPFDRLDGGQGVPGLRSLIEPAERLFDERGLALDCYLAGAPMARNMVGDAGLLSWARRGADLLVAGRSRGEAYFRMESEEGMRVLLEALPGYRARLHGRFLQLLLLAWLDAEIPLADGDWKPGEGRPMLETDGRRLYLPAVFDSRDEAIVAVQHGTAHLAFDSYAREHIEGLFARAGMEHPPLDDQSRITWRPLFAPFAERMFRFQILFDLAEDLRVNARLHPRIPGFLARLLQLARRQEIPDEPAGTYYRFALEAYRALHAGQAVDPRLQRMQDPAATVLDAWDAAEQLFADPTFPEIAIDQRKDAYLPGLSLNAARPVYPQRLRDGDLSDFRDVGDAYEEHRFVREKQEEAPEQTPEGAQKDPDADIQMPREETSGSGGRIGVGIPAPAQVAKRGVAWQPRSGGIPYPEWDYREQRMISDWVNLNERVLDEQDAGRAREILAGHAATLKRLTRGLEMQRPMRMAPLRRQMDGDELDTEAVIDFIADKRAGLSPKAFIYRRRAVRHRDTAVLLLADMSTSIMARHPGGDGKIVERVRSGLMLFAEAIDRIGDPCAIAGFASKQRDQVHYYWLKDFTEPLDDTVRGRIAGISGRLASRMGAAIRHSVRAMQRVSSQHRLLLILSDGRPADYDDGGDARYLHEDTRMAMKEAQDAGIHPFCITLDPSGEEYLPAIFGPGHYIIIDHIDELPRRLPEIYLRLRR